MSRKNLLKNRIYSIMIGLIVLLLVFMVIRFSLFMYAIGNISYALLWLILLGMVRLMLKKMTSLKSP